MCGPCVGQIVDAIGQCQLKLDCIIASAGACWGCACNTIAGMGLPFLAPICQSLSGGAQG